MIQQLNYAEAKKLMIESFNHDAAAHEAGDYELIGIDYDAFDGGLPRGAGTEFNKLFIALTFWDGWIDARNHDWQYYPGIEESDWPKLARQIVKSVKEEQEITEPQVLAHFDRANQTYRIVN